MDFNQLWAKLKEYMTDIIKIRKIDVNVYMECYTLVFKTCTNFKEAHLYYNLCEFLVEIVNQKVAELEVKSDLFLLLDYIEHFVNYLEAVKQIHGIFRYMQRYWIPAMSIRENGVCDVYKKSVEIWKENCFNKLQSKLLESQFANALQHSFTLTTLGFGNNSSDELNIIKSLFWNISIENWPKTYNAFPNDVQNSIKEVFICFLKIYKLPADLNILIIIKMLHMTMNY